MENKGQRWKNEANTLVELLVKHRVHRLIIVHGIVHVCSLGVEGWLHVIQEPGRCLAALSLASPRLEMDRGALDLPRTPSVTYIHIMIYRSLQRPKL